MDIASLSKMMTLYVTFRYISAGLIGWNDVWEVSANAASTTGTSACLKFGDQITVRDALHGLMLPSGNDAAVVIAEEIGGKIYELLPRAKKAGKTPLVLFVEEMNRTAHFLGLRKTRYANPHGLAVKGNKSTTADLGKLASQILAHDELKTIVSTKSYSCEVKNLAGDY
jgi:D-alanyl-D-alanine carboxypeptidase (penicillin-binding protein 5/6)